MDKKYTVEELAKELKVSKKTILREIKKGYLGTQKIGRRHLIPDRYLKTYLSRKTKLKKNLEEHLNGFTKEKKGEMVSLLQKMVSMPSVSSELGQENKLARFIKKTFDKWGVRCVVYEEGEAVAVRASVGYADEGFLLDAPLDTLPEGDLEKWNYPPFDGAIKGGRMYGRGTADCKAGIVSMMYTLLFLKRFVDEEKIRVETVFDGGEQDGSFTGIYQVIGRGVPVKNGIIGYAGHRDSVLVGARGYHRYEFTTQGEAVHTGSRYKPGVNAISKMAKFIDEVENIKLPQSKDPLFSFGSRLTFSQIDGGRAINMVPDSCIAKLDIRTTPEISKKMLDQKLIEIINSIKKQDKEFLVKFNYTVGHEAYMIEPDNKLPSILKSVIEKTTKRKVNLTASGPAHIGNVLAEHNIDMVVWGPVGDNMHSYNEFVEINSLPETVDIYVKTISEYFKLDDSAFITPTSAID